MADTDLREQIADALIDRWQLWGYEEVNDGRTHRAWPPFERVADAVLAVVAPALAAARAAGREDGLREAEQAVRALGDHHPDVADSLAAIRACKVAADAIARLCAPDGSAKEVTGDGSGEALPEYDPANPGPHHWPGPASSGEPS